MIPADCTRPRPYPHVHCSYCNTILREDEQCWSEICARRRYREQVVGWLTIPPPTPGPWTQKLCDRLRRTGTR